MARFEFLKVNHSDGSRRSTRGMLTLVLAGVLFVATVVLGFATIERMRQSVGWIIHSYDTRSQVRTVRTFSVDLTARIALAAAVNETQYFHDILRDIDGQQDALARLQLLTRDNAAQQERVRQLSQLVLEARSQVAPCIANPQCLPAVPAQRQEFFHELYDRQEKKAAILDSMQDAEQRLLEDRQSAWVSRFRLMVVALSLSFLTAIFLVFYNLQLLLNEINRRIQSERLIREHVDSYRALSGRVLELQDSERRKIARELHDSIGQYLASVKVQLGQIERAIDGNPAASKELIVDAKDLVERSITEIRTISHLLHPPLLDELGLYSAARWYTQGFAERSGLQVDFSVDDPAERMHKDAEIALFRVLQEALTNVHRHSGAKRVTIDIRRHGGSTVLLVKDDGHGIPTETLLRFQQGSGGGIGLAGMRERLTELGGSLNVQSAGSGTELRATLPAHACRIPRHQPDSVVA